MERKNVVLIVADALRADRPSYTGYRRKGQKLTPNIDKLAEDGKIFSKAYSTGAWTGVSQPPILTGLYASKLNYPSMRSDVSLDEETVTMAEKFKDAGYETRAYNISMVIDKQMGFDKGFDYYEDISRKDKIEPNFWHMEGMAWNLIFGRDHRTRYALKSIKRWLRSRNKDKPFFLFWNPSNPHNPYMPPKGFRHLERDVEKGMDEEAIDELAGYGPCMDYISGDMDLSDEEMDVVESRYDAEVAYLDHRVGQLIDYLKKRNLYDDTIIVFTSDHGENFGDQDRLIYHEFGINEALIRVPLVIKGEGFGQGLEERPVSLIDLMNSLLKSAAGSYVEGIDSSEALLEDSENREFILSEMDSKIGKSPEKELERRKPLSKPVKWYTAGKKAAIKGENKLEEDETGEIREFKITDLSEEETDLNMDIRKEMKERINDLGAFSSEDRQKDEEVKKELEKLGYL